MRMLNVCTMAEAERLLRGRFGGTHTETEQVPLAEAVSRVLADDAVSACDVPHFDRATVDGYAVIARDTFGASEAIPAVLRLTGSVGMGQVPAFTLRAGECAYVPTGGQIPDGADAMVMLESVQDYGQGERAVEKSAAPGQNLLLRGDDVRAGACLLPKGRVLTPADIGALAAVGLARVGVLRRIRAAVLSTGDELVPQDAAITGAAVRDVNGPMLVAGLRAAGAAADFCGIVPDERARIADALLHAASTHDLVLLSGGSSVGERDLTIPVLEQLGSVLFHGVAVRPGKPTIAGEIAGTPVIGLPGHPMAAYFMLRTLVFPLLTAMQGAAYRAVAVRAVLSRDIPSNHGREELVPVRLSGGAAQPLSGKSGLIRLLSEADGYLTVPRDAEGVRAGETVEVFLF